MILNDMIIMMITMLIYDNEWQLRITMLIPDTYNGNWWYLTIINDNLMLIDET